jgi:hypothetical protein
MEAIETCGFGDVGHLPSTHILAHETDYACARSGNRVQIGRHCCNGLRDAGARCRPAALPAAKSETAMPQPVERASAEDCAIIVEIGKAKMNWGATPPEFAFYPEFDGAEVGTYLEDCPWKDLGVADPLIGTPTSEKAFLSHVPCIPECMHRPI